MRLGSNPFESGHIKNYILLYASIVVIMVLFFFASDLFIEDKEIVAKVFDTKEKEALDATPREEQTEVKKKFTPKFKLLEQGY
ncbi:MAG: hypothetical protein FAF05_00905 [Epsilonproteobacteria bacterium]|nr:hypothetical protein [Campylobacterota bacterium]